MSWMDVLIVTFILINIISGLHKGFIMTAFNLVEYILAGIIAKIYYPFLANFIKNNTEFFVRIKKSVAEKIDIIISSNESPQTISSILNSFKLPDILKSTIIENDKIQSQAQNMGFSFSELISSTLTDMLIDIISIIIVFIIAKIILRYIVRLLDRLAKLPILNQFNKISGLLLGSAKGVLIIYIVFALLTPIILMSPNGFIAESTYSSTLGKFFYSNNIIIIFLRNRGFIS